ncbi:MAG: UvrD-helicase domain-containing protein, partial [Oscillospiraceae bacterium]|nr:UvrD-helicase domain-containing protein [Oscillospiraceae bacterium]
MNWTPEQEQAITIRGKSIIVSASAGSGKTAVLVERLLRILSDMKNQVKADEIIVVTFTNDAAAEMKQRLTKAISEKLDSMNIMNINMNRNHP